MRMPVLSMADGVDVIKEGGLDAISLTRHQILDLLAVALGKESKAKEVWEIVQRNFFSKLPSKKSCRRLQTQRSFQLELSRVSPEENDD